MTALVLAGACLPVQAQPRPLADGDLLYCAQVYAEAGSLLRTDPDPAVRRTGRDALARSRPLGARDLDLLNDDPARHKRASVIAGQRLAAMPVTPREARRLALRAAYLECRQLEAPPAGGAPAATSAAPAPAASAPAAAPIDLAFLFPEETLPPLAARQASPAGGSGFRRFWRALLGKPGPATTVTPATVPDPPILTPVSAWDDDAPADTAGIPAPLASLPPPTPTPTSTPAVRQEDAAALPPRTTTPPASARAPERRAASPVRAPAPSAAAALSDADLLYCEQVYGEVAATVGDGHGEAVEAARDARERWRPLNERDYDLLNESPSRHARATSAARQRLAALPAKPGRARSVALRTAYEECRGLEAAPQVAARPLAGGERIRMQASRHFCRDLLLTRLKVSPKIRAGFTPSELAALDEIQKIAGALAQPLPGEALTLEQDREANQLVGQLRETLDQAVANWSSGPDPLVQAMGQCRNDYVEGRLGGPDVLSRADEAVAATAAAAASPLPVVRMADLGHVFHMREMTPAGNFNGIWFRRGQTNVYDAVWVQGATGQMQRDVLELRGIINDELTLYRQSFHGTYRARVRPDGTLAPGEASWFDNMAYSWGPLPPQNVRPASGDLGAMVHMREVTPYGNYEGIWRQRGQTGVYDVIWVFLPTGEVTADVLLVSGVARGQLIIRRQGGPSIYTIKRRADSMTYKDPASGGHIMSKWVVVPAQPVRLGKAPHR